MRFSNLLVISPQNRSHRAYICLDSCSGLSLHPRAWQGMFILINKDTAKTLVCYPCQKSYRHYLSRRGPFGNLSHLWNLRKYNHIVLYLASGKSWDARKLLHFRCKSPSASHVATLIAPQNQSIQRVAPGLWNTAEIEKWWVIEDDLPKFQGNVIYVYTFPCVLNFGTELIRQELSPHST